MEADSTFLPSREVSKTIHLCVNFTIVFYLEFVNAYFNMNACRYSYTRTRLYWLGFDVTASNMRDGIAYSKSRFFLQFVYRRRIQHYNQNDHTPNLIQLNLNCPDGQAMFLTFLAGMDEIGCERKKGKRWVDSEGLVLAALKS